MLKKIFPISRWSTLRGPIEWMRWVLVFLAGMAVGLWVMYALDSDILAQCEELAIKVHLLLAPKTSFF